MAQRQTVRRTRERQHMTFGRHDRGNWSSAIAILVGKPQAEFSLESAPMNLQVPFMPTCVPAQHLEHWPTVADYREAILAAFQQVEDNHQ
jgi:Holliday junction resolvase RusA-like endonuclease